MQDEGRTISLSASELSWDDVDQHATSKGFKERSRYIQYLVEKDIYKTKHNYKEILVITLLLLLSIMTLTILLKV